MILFEFLLDSYILFRNTRGTEKYWKENAVGYTEDIEDAGVYTGKEVVFYNLKVSQYHEVKSGKDKQYTHYAMTVKDAIKLLK